MITSLQPSPDRSGPGCISKCCRLPTRGEGDGQELAVEAWHASFKVPTPNLCILPWVAHPRDRRGPLQRPRGSNELRHVPAWKPPLSDQDEVGAYLLDVVSELIDVSSGGGRLETLHHQLGTAIPAQSSQRERQPVRGGIPNKCHGVAGLDSWSLILERPRESSVRVGQPTEEPSPFLR